MTVEDIREIPHKDLESLGNKGFKIKGQLADGRVFVSEPDGRGQLYSWEKLERLIKETNHEGS